MTADLRLAAPAAACWLTAGVLCAAPGQVAAAAGLLWLGSVAAIGIGLVDRWPRRSRSQKGSQLRGRWRAPAPAPGRPGWRALWGTLGVTFAAAALVATVIAATASARLPGEVRSAAERHAIVTGTVTIGTMAAETQSFQGFSGFSSRVRFRGTLTELRLDGRTVPVSVPVVVFAESTASASRALEIGSSVRLTGTVQVAQPGDAAAVLFFGRGPPEAGTGPPWWLGWAGELRHGFSDAASRLPGDGGDLLPGLAIGDTTAVSDELDGEMKTSSLNHLTAVSGANCAVVIASIMLLGGALRLRRGVRIALSLAVLVGFVTLVTPEPSVLRAGVMASVVLLSIGIGRPGGGMPALALVVIVLLAGDPWLSRNYGFALSVLATAGLLVLAGPVTRALSRWMPTGLAALISIPLAAQLACQPVLVLLSPSLPLYGVPANLLAAPAAPLATVVGLLGCLLLPWAPGLAGTLLGAAWLPSAWIAAVARTTAALPGSRLPWPGGAVGLTGIVLVTLLVLILVFRQAGARGARRRTAALALLLASLGAYSGSLIGTGVGRAAAFPDDWQIAACDIGQGDAVVVRDGDRYALIDVGPDPKPLAACLRTLGIDRIDLLVLTHYDMDHIGGIDAVLGRVDTALVGIPENDQDRRLHDRLAEGGALLRQSARGDSGALGGLRWEILWPVRGSPVMQVGNPGSVTIGFDGRGIRSLFLGDLGEEAQDAMSRASRPAALDVVKVAHHGSADQSPELYARLRATVGLIGVGADNGYGHPTDALLDMLSGVGTTAFRTDRQGMLVVAPAAQRGGALTVWTEKVPPRASGSPGARDSRRAGPSPAPARLERAIEGNRVAARTTAPRALKPAQKSASKSTPKTAAIPQLAWHQVRPAPVLLVSGTESFLAERAIRQLRDFLKLEDPELEVSDVQADSYAPGEILTLASPSLFGEPRLIRVRSVEKCTDAFLTEALDYLQNPAEDTYLVLRHGGGVRGKKLLDTIRSGVGGGIEIVCAELKKDTDKHDFASAEFKTAGKRVTASALRALVSAFSDDLAELSAACQQLISDSSAEVTEVTVDRYYGGRVEANAFKVADSAIAGRHGEALVTLRHALSSGADPVPIVAAFAMKIRTMAKLFGVRGGSGQLASQFGLAPWQVERAQRDLRGWSDEGLARCITMLAETDANVKGGGRDPVFALERLIGVIARRGED